MYDIVKEVDAISQVLPETVNRLLALKDIHEQGKSEMCRIDHILLRKSVL